MGIRLPLEADEAALLAQLLQIRVLDEQPRPRDRVEAAHIGLCRALEFVHGQVGEDSALLAPRPPSVPFIATA